MNQHVQLYEEVAHLPLLIHVPGLKPGRNDDLVQLVDVGPTVLDLAGVPVPPSMQGRSWLPLLAGEQGVRHEFAWSGTALQVPGRYRPSTVTTSDGWCLIHNGRVQPPPPGQRQWMVLNRLEEEILPAHLPPSELYYLPEDPRQERNLIADRPDVARSLHRQYLGFLEELGVPEAALSPRREL